METSQCGNVAMWQRYNVATLQRGNVVIQRGNVVMWKRFNVETLQCGNVATFQRGIVEISTLQRGNVEISTLLKRIQIVAPGTSSKREQKGKSDFVGLAKLSQQFHGRWLRRGSAHLELCVLCIFGETFLGFE